MKIVLFEGACPECKTSVKRREFLKNTYQEFPVTCSSCGHEFNLPVKGTKNSRITKPF